MNSWAPAIRAAARTRSSPASRGPERDVLGDSAAEQRRALRDPGDRAAPRGRIAACQVHIADRDPSGERIGEAQQQARHCALAGAARPDQGGRLARRQLEIDVLEHRARTRRVGERDALEEHRRAVRARRLDAPRGRGLRLLDERQQPVRHGEPVGARVVLRAQGAQRQVDLGGEDQHGQSRLQGEVPADQAQADRDRDERHAEGRGEVEDSAGQERHPQRPERGAPVLVAALRDGLGLAGRAVERRAASAGRARRRRTTRRARSARASAGACAAPCRRRRGP